MRMGHLKGYINKQEMQKAQILYNNEKKLLKSYIISAIIKKRAEAMAGSQGF